MINSHRTARRAHDPRAGHRHRRLRHILVIDHRVDHLVGHKSTTASGSTKPSTDASGGAATETTIVATGGGSFCKNVAVKAAEASLATYVKQHCGIDVGSPTTSTP
jgi:hypothetical protein